jgi:tetratricopeptide (TPR) repeat protein
MKHALSLLALLCFFVLPSFADEGHHHEDLSAAQLGTVNFPASCAASEQKPFERGVALLHSFWYEEAEKQFAAIAKDDPKCAMAHWGIAMSLWHQLWDHPDDAILKRGLEEVEKAQSLHPPTQRERDYIAAIGDFYAQPGKREYQQRADAYCQAMQQMDQHYPDDKEAAAFYALSLLAAEPYDDTTFARRKEAAKVLEPLFTAEPNHPGVAHYLIHAYDKPQLAQLGLPAAERYAKIAPASPHALHMPSHIFARLGLWQQDIDSNLASIAATRKTAAMHMGGADHQFHAMDFLLYAYLQSGREADAAALIAEVEAMPPMVDEHDNYNMQNFALSDFPAMYDLELHHWSDAAQLTPVSGADPADAALTYWARAIGAARSGNPTQARTDIAKLAELQKQLAAKHRDESATMVAWEQQGAQAWLSYAEGNTEAGLSSLRDVSSKEEATGGETGGIPSREMLADMLLEMKRPGQALTEYQATLKLNPNRFNSVYGAAQAAELSGQIKQAGDYYAQLIKICAGSASNRPELARARSLQAKE